MVILRYFRFICISGVVIGTISFVLGLVAIGTGSWLLSQEYRLISPDAGPVTTSTVVISVNGTVNDTTIGTEITPTTDNTTPAAGEQTTAVAGETSSPPGPQIITVRATSGLWHLCQSEVRDGVTGEWECLNIISNLSEMNNAKQLSPLVGAISSRTNSPTEFNMTMEIQTSEVYFHSMLAFELIGVAATLAGCCVAGIAMFKQQPLAVLVAAFTMFFSGMFMLVGHSMMLSIHTSRNDDTSGGTESGWHHGWSFIVAWLAFGLCLIAGVINCIVYRNFRKMSEELTGTPSRVKYANRPPPPVNLGSSI